MNPAAHVPGIDTEQLIAHIRQGQVDLSILAEWLARDSNPEIPEIFLLALGVLHWHAGRCAPSHSRH
jgi:hypothetical protein